MTSTPIKKPSARKPLCLFDNIFEVKNITYYRQFRAAKSKRKSIKFGNIPWSLNKRRKGNPKIDEQIKKSPYNWIMHYPQVVQSPIDNDCLTVKIDVHNEPQLVTKLLFQVSIRELHNNLVSSTLHGGIEETRDEDDNIIIVILHQLENTS